MKTFRTIAGILALIPLGLLVEHILWQAGSYGEGSLRQMIFVVLGIPILALNLWIWMYPGMMEVYFLNRKG